MLRRFTPLIALLLVVLVAGPANAATTVKREWNGAVNGGANGSAQLIRLDERDGQAERQREGAKQGEHDLSRRAAQGLLQSNPGTVLGQAGLLPDERLGLGGGREGDHQEPDGPGSGGRGPGRSPARFISGDGGGVAPSFFLPPRDPGPHSLVRHQPARRAGPERLSVLQRRDVHALAVPAPPSPASRSSTPTPARACSCRCSTRPRRNGRHGR